MEVITQRLTTSCTKTTASGAAIASSTVRPSTAPGGACRVAIRHSAYAGSRISSQVAAVARAVDARVCRSKLGPAGASGLASGGWAIPGTAYRTVRDDVNSTLPLRDGRKGGRQLCARPGRVGLRPAQPGFTDTRRASWCPGAPDRGPAPRTAASPSVDG